MNHSRHDNRGRTRRFLYATVMATVAAFAGSDARAADEPAKEGEAEPAAENTHRPRFDLGAFHVRDLRPTRDVTADLKFSLHLQLRDDVSEAAVSALEHWKHRLRDQAITAIRTAQMVDFTDPDLARVRRLINLRVNRLLPHPLVDEILVTSFTLGDL